MCSLYRKKLYIFHPSTVFVFKDAMKVQSEGVFPPQGTRARPVWAVMPDHIHHHFSTSSHHPFLIPLLPPSVLCLFQTTPLRLMSPRRCFCLLLLLFLSLLPVITASSPPPGVSPHHSAHIGTSSRPPKAAPMSQKLSFKFLSSPTSLFYYDLLLLLCLSLGFIYRFLPP